MKPSTLEGHKGEVGDPSGLPLVLYHAPWACSLVPLILLLEVEARFSLRVVDLRKSEQLSKAFLRINPKHKVPVLTIGEHALTENVAILQWIARQYSKFDLLPQGLDEFRGISLLAWCASNIHPALTPNASPQRFCDLPDSHESVRRCAQALLHEYYSQANELLVDRMWFFDKFTAVDAYFFWCFRRGTQFGIAVDAYRNCLAHYERMLARDSVTRGLKFEAADAS